MPSVLDALGATELAEAVDRLSYHLLERGLVQAGLTRLLLQRLQRFVSVPNPVAGADWTTIVGAGVAWELLQVRGLLTTSATVATRFPGISILSQDGASLGDYGGGDSVTASFGAHLTWAACYGSQSNVTDFNSPAPGETVLISAGYSVASVTANLQAGDQWSGVTLVVREWSPAKVVAMARSILRDLDSEGGIAYTR